MLTLCNDIVVHSPEYIHLLRGHTHTHTYTKWLKEHIHLRDQEHFPNHPFTYYVVHCTYAWLYYVCLDILI